MTIMLCDLSGCVQVITTLIKMDYTHEDRKVVSLLKKASSTKESVSSAIINFITSVGVADVHSVHGSVMNHNIVAVGGIIRWESQ